jgi:hypothetical protein
MSHQGRPLVFPERELSDAAENVDGHALEVGTVYYKVEFMDAQLRIPSMTPVVYAGRVADGGHAGDFLFQDYESYQLGVRYPAANQRAEFEAFAAEDGPSVFDFEGAVDCLLRSWIRRSR